MTYSLSRESNKDFSLDYCTPQITEEGEKRKLFHETNLSQGRKSQDNTDTREERLKQAAERLSQRQKDRENQMQSTQSKNQSISGILAALKLDNLLETREERMRKAEERLKERQYANAVAQDLVQIEAKTGLFVSIDLNEHEWGIYRGTHHVAGRSYGLIEKEDGSAKLIPVQQLESREIGYPMHIQKQTRSDGEALLKGVQQHVRERKQDQDLELRMTQQVKIRKTNKPELLLTRRETLD